MSGYVPSDEAVEAARDTYLANYGGRNFIAAILTTAVPIELARLRERVAEGLHDALAHHHGGLPWAELDGPHRRNTYERVDQMLGLDALPGEGGLNSEAHKAYRRAQNEAPSPSELQGEPSLEVGDCPAITKDGGLSRCDLAAGHEGPHNPVPNHPLPKWREKP